MNGVGFRRRCKQAMKEVLEAPGFAFAKGTWRLVDKELVTCLELQDDRARGRCYVNMGIRVLLVPPLRAHEQTVPGRMRIDDCNAVWRVGEKFEYSCGQSAVDQLKVELVAELARAERNWSEFPQPFSELMPSPEELERLYGIVYGSAVLLARLMARTQLRCGNWEGARAWIEHGRQFVGRSQLGPEFDSLERQAKRRESGAY